MDRLKYLAMNLSSDMDRPSLAAILDKWSLGTDRLKYLAINVIFDMHRPSLTTILDEWSLGMDRLKCTWR
jgi:hypothetical protein